MHFSKFLSSVIAVSLLVAPALCDSDEKSLEADRRSDLSPEQSWPNVRRDPEVPVELPEVDLDARDPSKAATPARKGSVGSAKKASSKGGAAPPPPPPPGRKGSGGSTNQVSSQGGAALPPPSSNKGSSSKTASSAAAAGGLCAVSAKGKRAPLLPNQGTTVAQGRIVPGGPGQILVTTGLDTCSGAVATGRGQNDKKVMAHFSPGASLDRQISDFLEAANKIGPLNTLKLTLSCPDKSQAGTGAFAQRVLEDCCNKVKNGVGARFPGANIGTRNPPSTSRAEHAIMTVDARNRVDVQICQGANIAPHKRMSRLQSLF